MVLVRRFLFSLLLLLPGLALAQNLHPNGEFEADPVANGWSATQGSLYLATPDASACPFSGSLGADCTEVNPSLYSLSAVGPCVAAPAGGTVLVRFLYEGGVASFPGDLGIFLGAYSGPTCTGSPVDSDGASFFEAMFWTSFAGSVAVPAGGSFRISLSGGADLGCGLTLDRIQVTYDPVLLLDDFDGGLCRWSSSVGG